MNAVLAPLVRAGSPLGRTLIDSAFLSDPYPTYQALREAGPIHWSAEFFGGAWLLMRHEDVQAVLRDKRFSAQRTGDWITGADAAARREMGAFQRLFARAMLFVDAPDHTRLRQVLQAGFRPSALQDMAPQIEALVGKLLDGMASTPSFDFMAQVARPLPARVIAMLMDIPDDDRADFAVWSDDLAAFIGASKPTLDLARRAQTSLLAMSHYFESLLAVRRRKPGDDLVSRLVRAEAAGLLKGEAELLAQCAMLLFAGHETTRNLLGNGLYSLLSHADQLKRVLHQPALMSSAVVELLRHESPVQYTGRRVTTDLVLHGQTLRRGDLVIALIGAANRDPRRYVDADRLDVTRKQGLPLSFGYGAHVCIGATLTLMETEIALRQVLNRWPELKLDDAPPRWTGNPVYRGLHGLPVHTT